jgi:dephospho-CoA kinase
MATKTGGKKLALGLTGGIATGKSTAMSLIERSFASVVVFDADKVVQRLLASEEVVSRIAESLGMEIQHRDGTLNRSALRELVFANPERRKQLEGILHPKVREECLVKRQDWLRNKSSTIFVADVPLLFEGGFDFHQDLNLVVATSVETQRSRLKRRNHFDDKMISSILAAQLPILEKVGLANIVFWNEGPKEVLESQLKHFFDVI